MVVSNYDGQRYHISNSLGMEDGSLVCEQMHRFIVQSTASIIDHDILPNPCKKIFVVIRIMPRVTGQRFTVLGVACRRRLQLFQQSFCFLNTGEGFPGGQKLLQLFTCLGLVARFNKTERKMVADFCRLRCDGGCFLQEWQAASSVALFYQYPSQGVQCCGTARCKLVGFLGILHGAWIIFLLVEPSQVI